MKKQISIKNNIIANYIGQAYRAVIGIIMMPLYLSYLGTEGFGLIGFYIMLQSWMQLLDIGMKPTLARESARYKAGAITALDLRRSLRTLEVVFVIIGSLITLSTIFASDLISRSWLNVENLDLATVSFSVSIMGIVVGIRWVSNLYNGVVSGLERQVWLNSYGVIFATIRFVAVLVHFELFGASLEVFFIYQLVTSVIEGLVIIVFAYKNIAKVNEKVSYSFKVLKGILKLSIGIAFGSVIWIVVTQVDKLILSKSISLVDYGYFSLAIVISNGLLVIGTSIGAAIMPRMTIYSEKGNSERLERLYFLSVEAVLVIVIPISSMLIFYGSNILYFWTGDVLVSEKSSEIMKWYVLGNVMVSMGAFAYYLQYAKGNFKLHIIGNIIYAIMLIPAQVYIATYFGPVYTGILWFIANFLIVTLWLGVIHKKYLPNKHLLWLWSNLRIFLGGYLSLYLISSYITIDFEYSIYSFSKILFLGLVSFLLSVAFSSELKIELYRFFQRKLIQHTS